MLIVIRRERPTWMSCLIIKESFMAAPVTKTKDTPGYDDVFPFFIAKLIVVEVFQDKT